MVKVSSKFVQPNLSYSQKTEKSRGRVAKNDPFWAKKAQRFDSLMKPSYCFFRENFRYTIFDYEERESDLRFLRFSLEKIL